MSRRLEKALLLWFAILLFCYGCAIKAEAAKIPKNLKVDGQFWEIKRVKTVDKTDHHITGTTECQKHQIIVDESLSRFELVTIVIHEWEHAITCDRGDTHNEKWNNDESKEDCDGHCGIYWSAPRISEFIRQNPEFIRFVLDTEPPQMDCSVSQPLPMGPSGPPSRDPQLSPPTIPVCVVNLPH